MHSGSSIVHVDHEPAGVRGGDEAVVDERAAADLRRHGQHLTVYRTTAEAVGGKPEPADRRGTDRRARRSARQLPDAGQAPVAEGPEAHPAERCAARYHVDERPDDGVVLGVDAEARVRERLEQVHQARDRLTTGAQLADALPREVVHTTSNPGHAAEVGVVEDDDLAVGTEVHVGLQVAVAESHRPREGDDGVLGGFLGTAAVGDRDRRRCVQVGVHRARTIPAAARY